MEYREVERLADQYQQTLEEEFKANFKTATAQKEADDMATGLLIAVLEEGTFNGKNEPARKLQRAVHLLADAPYQLALVKVSIRQAEADIETIDRKHAEALIGLTKAWLYSQQGGTVINKSVGFDFENELAVDWVREHYCVEQVFPVGDLIQWARDNGFVSVDVPETGPGRDC